MTIFRSAIFPALLSVSLSWSSIAMAYDPAAAAAAANRIMQPAIGCRTPWACVGKDCGNWGTGPRPTCRTPEPRLKLVSLQLDVSGTTKEARAAAAIRLIEQAVDAEGKGVYVLPEYTLCPLPNAAAAAAHQEPVPGPMTGRFGEIARKRGIWIVIGMSETSTDPMRPYNAIVILGPQGELYRYHKTHLYEPGVEGSIRETQMYMPGESLDVFNIEGWCVGVMVCFDGNFPEVPRVLSLKGAQIILYCNGRNIVGQEAEVASAANATVVLVANYVGYSGMDTGLGTSRIITPPQDNWAKPVVVEGQKEGWIAKELIYEDVERWRNLEVVGRCPTIDPRSRRPELYGILTEGAGPGL